MLGFLAPIIATIAGGIKNWSNNRKEIKTAEQKLKIAIIENKARLAEAEDTHNSAWEMKQLDLSDTLLRRCTFFLMASPFVIGIFWPNAVNNYMKNVIGIVPPWWREIVIIIIMAIWGIKAVGDKVPMIIQALRGIKNNSSKD